MIKSVLAALALAAVSGPALAQTAPAQDHSGHADHAAAPAATSTPLPTINSSIRELLDNPATAAVLEKHLPGVSQHPALPQVEDMTLEEVAPYSQGEVTAAIIRAIDADLKALPAA